MTSRLSPNERIQRAINILQEGQLSFLTALIKVLDPSEKDFSAYRGGFYVCTKDQPTGKLAKLLDKIWSDSRGRSQILAWMEPQMLSHVTQRVSDEMDGVKDSLRGKISAITRDALINWDMTSIAEVIIQHAPLVTEILHSGAQTDRANRVNTQKDYSTVCSGMVICIRFLMRAFPLQACQVMGTQLAKLRSNYSLAFAAPFSLFLWMNGTSRQVIEALA